MIDTSSSCSIFWNGSSSRKVFRALRAGIRPPDCPATRWIFVVFRLKPSRNPKSVQFENWLSHVAKSVQFEKWFEEEMQSCKVRVWTCAQWKSPIQNNFAKMYFRFSQLFAVNENCRCHVAFAGQQMWNIGCEHISCMHRKNLEKDRTSETTSSMMSDGNARGQL